MDKRCAMAHVAKAIKELEQALWHLDPGMTELTIRQERRNLYQLIESNGYELTDAYRLVKARKHEDSV